MRLQFPVFNPVNFVKEAVKGLEYKLTNPQKTNLMLILTAIMVCGSLNLSTLSFTLLGKRSINALSHFFSYARLNVQKLMASAVNWAIRKMQISGASVRLAIDDTMKHHSRGAKKISRVYWLFDHVTQSYCNAACIVFVYLVINERIRFPVGWRVYRQGGKSKWKLAIEIIDDILEMDLKISVVLFDSWFCVKGFIKQLERRKLTFIGDMKSSNALEYRLPDQRTTVRLTLAKILKYGRSLFKKVCLGLKSSEDHPPDKVLYETYTKVGYVAAFGGRYQIVHSIDRRTKASKIFVCNNLSWEAQKILEEYSYRWMIEEFFGNAKGLCGLEKACVRSEQAGAITLFLVSFVDLLISIELWKGIHDDPGARLPKVSAVFATVTEENLRSFLSDPESNSCLEKVIAFWSECLREAKNGVRRIRKSLGIMENLSGVSSPTREERSFEQDLQRPSYSHLKQAI